MFPLTERTTLETEVEKSDTQYGFTWFSIDDEYRIRSPDDRRSLHEGLGRKYKYFGVERKCRDCGWPGLIGGFYWESKRRST